VTPSSHVCVLMGNVISHRLDIRDTGIFGEVKNQVFLRIFDGKNGNTAEVRHTSFKTNNICAFKSLFEITNINI
jgi:hypothetical protein